MKQMIWMISFLYFCAIPVFAKPVPQSHRQAAEKLMALTEMEKSVQQGVESFIHLQLKSKPELAQKKEILRRFYSDQIGWDAMKDEIIGLYVEGFTEQELNEMVGFYSTPTGKKMIHTVPVLMMERAKIAMLRIQQSQPKLQKQLKNKIN